MRIAKYMYGCQNMAGASSLSPSMISQHLALPSASSIELLNECHSGLADD